MCPNHVRSGGTRLPCHPLHDRRLEPLDPRASNGHPLRVAPREDPRDMANRWSPDIPLETWLFYADPRLIKCRESRVPERPDCRDVVLSTFHGQQGETVLEGLALGDHFFGD